MMVGNQLTGPCFLEVQAAKTGLVHSGEFIRY